jgi:hypothetical protein
VAVISNVAGGSLVPSAAELMGSPSLKLQRAINAAALDALQAFARAAAAAAESPTCRHPARGATARTSSQATGLRGVGRARARGRGKVAGGGAARARQRGAVARARRARAGAGRGAHQNDGPRAHGLALRRQWRAWERACAGRGGAAASSSGGGGGGARSRAWPRQHERGRGTREARDIRAAAGPAHAREAARTNYRVDWWQQARRNATARECVMRARALCAAKPSPPK